MNLKKINCTTLLILFITLMNYSVLFANSQNIPKDFINILDIDNTIQVDIKYFSNDNFIGKPVNGYNAPVCLLTKQTAVALSKVNNKLKHMGLSLKVYDCYRPQMAVDEFIDWAKNTKDFKMQKEFYVEILTKQQLFTDGYIASNSGHSRGSTVDVTIVPLNSEIPKYDPKLPQVSCTANYEDRKPDNSLDFGTGYDCFSTKSHPTSKNISPQASANRLLLQNLMINAGFKALSTEWWHFTLINEPYPDTYFNFYVDDYKKSKN